MNRSSMRVLGLLAALAVLSFGLAGCGGDEPAPVAAPPAPPPAPPPFQPEAVEVALGDNGGNITLMTTEAGGYTLNGEAFESGAAVEGEGGRSYVLTLADGTWSAAFQPMEVMVALGGSGESVTLMTTEAGGYMMGDAAVESGGMTMTSTGASYTLTMGEDGMWMATFMPATQTVTLGTSGNSVDLMTNEAGMWMIGDTALMADGSDTYMMGGLTYGLAMGEDGMWMATFMPMTQTVMLGSSGSSVMLSSTESGGWAMGTSAFASGGTAEAANGNNYTLTLGEDGMWMAMFAPMRVDVKLGTSEDTATLWTAEKVGDYTMDGQLVVSGSSTAMNQAGQSYTLTMGEDGMWMATHMPMTEGVTIGSSGTIMLMTNEAGRWTMDGEIVSSGDSVEGNDNAATGMKNMYELTYTEADGWSAAYQARTMDIGGTGLEASAREDGTGYDVGAEGSGMSLDADGMGEVTAADGGMFRVMRSEAGTLAGTRYDMDIVGKPMVEVAFGDHATPPSLETDDRKTDFNEKGTMLNALGAQFSMGDLLGAGAATKAGPNIVADARDEIAKIRDRVAQLVALRREDGGLTELVFTQQLNTQWDNADEEIEKIFPGDRLLERTLSVSRVVDAFQRVVDALSSEEAFAAATLDGGPDKLQGFNNRSPADAAKAFNRVKWNAEARLGAIGSTRFGAAMYNSTVTAQQGPGPADRVQAFAWSTMQDVRRATDVRASGVARYDGTTLAADNMGALYSGSIEINVNFTRMSVNGFVSALATADTQTPWSHGLGGEVTGIYLPNARMDRGGAWTVTGGGTNRGRLQYAAQAGGEPDLDLEPGATYKGQLLGRGDASGSEAIGTWKLEAGSTTLAGAFGAERGPDRAPPGAGVIENLGAIGKRGTVFASLENRPGNIAAVPAQDPLDGTERPVIASSKVINTGNANFTYNAPPRYIAATVADNDANEFVTGNYNVARATVLEDGDYENPRRNWVADARAAIETKLGQLRRSIALDNADASDSDRRFANDQRQRLYTEMQEEIRKVFGPDVADDAATTDVNEELHTGVLTKDDRYTGAAWTAHVDYPVNSTGVAQDAGVIAQIEDVLAALDDAEAFAAALGDNGVFAGQTGNANFEDYPSASAIFGRPRGKLRMATEATDFTRLGGWMHQISDYAAAILRVHDYVEDDDASQYGAFAYSPLDPTPNYDVDNRLYPANNANATVSATYAGRTSAAQGNTFYTGAFEATVYWDPSSVSESRVNLTISELQDTVNGDPLEFGYARAGHEVVGTVEVESLSWTAGVTQDGVVRFKNTLSGEGITPTVTVGVDSVSGTPNWRPVPGSAFVEGGNFKRFERQSGGHHLRYGTSATNYFAAVTDGTGALLNGYGELSFDGTGTADTPTATITRTGIPYDNAKKAFEDGQVSLAYPKWMIAGPRLRPAGTTSNDRPSIILLYADGSTRHIDHYANFNNQAYMFDVPDADGDVNRPASSMELHRVSGNPLLSAQDNLRLFNDVGQPWSKDIATDDGGTTIGQGAPDPDTMQPGDIALAWLKANEYVNVLQSDTDALASEIDGMFVGYDQDGPLGLIGTWSLTGSAFGQGTERGEIRGAFGADVQP